MMETQEHTELSVMSESQLREAKMKLENERLKDQAVANEAADAFAADMGEGDDDDEFQIDEDDDNGSYADEDFGGAADDDDFEAPDDENTKPYQNKLQAEVVRKKNTSISVSQAKLFGIPMDGKGKVVVPGAKPPDTDKQLTRILNRIGKMSEPGQSDLSHIKSEDDMESTFRPQKSAAAIALMKNPKLGYDFIDKLENEKDGFLKRAFDNKDGEMTSLEKVKKADAEEEYKLSKDKLQCPVHWANHKCIREQSFNEFWEKKRFCPQCKVRFVKVNVCDPEKFNRRMKEKEIQRQKRLKEIEAKMYSYEKPKYSRPKDFTLDLPSSHARTRHSGATKDFKDTDDEAIETGDTHAKPREPVMKSVGRVYVPAKKVPTEGGEMEDKTEEDLSAELLEKLANLNSSKAALMEEVVAAAEDRAQQGEEFNRSLKEPKIVGGRSSRSSSHASAKSVASDNKSKASSTRAGGGSGGVSSIAASKGPRGEKNAPAASKGSKRTQSASGKGKKDPPPVAPVEFKGEDKFDRLIM